MVGLVIAPLALLLVLVAPGIAQDRRSTGRIAATFYPTQGAAPRSKAGSALPDADKEAQPALASMSGPFRVDPKAPIHIEADSVETSDGQAVFSGDVRLHQGDFLLRTPTLTAFYLGQLSVRSGDEWSAEQLTRVDVKEMVLVTSQNGQTATGRWATFDVMANTVLLGGERAVVTRTGEDPLKPDVAVGERIKVDLTTGMFRFESDGAPASQQPASPTPRP